MEKYKIILTFSDGKTLDSVVTDKKPTNSFAKQCMILYKADKYEIVTVNG